MALKKKTPKKKINKKKIVKKTAKKVIKKTPRKTVKKAVKKPVKKSLKNKSNLKKKAPKNKISAKSKEPILGIVTHYFPHVQAAVIKMKLPLEIGQAIKVKGHTTEFTQSVSSMQIDRTIITKAKKGDEIGLQVISRVRQGDLVYIA